MAYIFDQGRNIFIDDEDKSLGNKLALVDDDELDKAIKQIELEQGPGTVFPASEAPTPPKTIERDMFKNAFKESAADGGLMRQNFAVAGLALPALSYPITLSLAKILGVSTAGVGAAELGNRVTDYLKENPQVFNDPRFKAAALTFGINIPGVIAPDADEMEREAEKIRELTKPVGSPAETEKMPIKTGETTPPKIDTKESFPAELEKLPFREEFPIEDKQLPIIFENQKADSEKQINVKDLKKDFKNKSWKDTVKITGSPAQGTRESIPQKTNIPFFEKLNTYSKQKHAGNLKSAIREVAGLPQMDKKTGDKKFESLYTSILNAANRSGFKFETTQNTLESNIELSKVPVNFVDFTNSLKDSPAIINNRLKELKVNKNKIYNRQELQDILGIDTSKKRSNTFFAEVLKDQGLTPIEMAGGKKGFRLNETISALKDYSKNKLKIYESRKYNSSIKKKSSENFKLRSKVDGRDFTLLNRQINKAMSKTLGENELYFPDSVAQLGHNPVPIALTERISMLNDKELSDKIFNIQNYTWQGKEINYDVLAKTSAKLETALKKLNRFYNKKITEKNIGTVEEAIDEIRNYYDSAVEGASEVSKRLPFHKEVIGKLDISVPEIGDKLTADNFNVDMSNVDSRFIIGNVDLLNPNATKYKDLSKEEKIKYGQSIIDQKTEQLKEFYGPNGADFPPEIIEDLVEQFEFGDATTLGAIERKGLGFKKGGGVEITPMPRVDFNGGGAVGADDNFAKELEYFLLNPDAELPKADSYRETMNPVALLNDMIDPRNYAYYADRLAETGVRIGEFGARVLPALGQLTADLIKKPAFKFTGGTNQGYVQEYTDVPPSNIKGTGIFTEFLNNLVGTEGTKVITEKTGIAELIRSEEQKQKDRRSTIGPKVLADQVTLGAELTAPIFPGLKLLKAYAKNRKLPVNDTTKEILNKEIDEVLETQNLTRRDFLKATGAGGAVILAKMLGFGDELATTTKVAEKVAKDTVGGTYPPPYFFKLVEKIRFMGDDITEKAATQDRQVVKRYKDYEMSEDAATGEITILKRNEGSFYDQDGILSEEYIVYKPGIADETTKSTPPPEYEEFTVRPDSEGKLKDSEDGLDSIEEILEEVGDPDSLTLKK